MRAVYVEGRPVVAVHAAFAGRLGPDDRAIGNQGARVVLGALGALAAVMPDYEAESVALSVQTLHLGVAVEVVDPFS